MVPDEVDRRELLAALGAGAAGAAAGCTGLFGGGDPQSTAEPVAQSEARRLAEAYAPTLYFDDAETWYPTDPRPYTSERDGETVVRGFDAVEGYLQAYEASSEQPPDPTVFYRAVRYDDGPLAVVQYWLYSAFDQFATNFHWHDWELLQAFVDTEAEEPVLYVASAHSRSVPNNEHLDPATAPRVLAELGSHSSGMSVNDRPASFQRFPLGDSVADITNEVLGSLAAIADIPLAYGLPRDEGSRLPYVVPELDGEPVYEHPSVPTFRRDHLAPSDLTVRSFDALSSPPTDLPPRETGTTMAHEGGDVAYDLAPTSDVEHVDAFTGPQLSFEFSVPGFVEDAIASHITTAGTPWDQRRYDDPLADVTDPTHRNMLAERYDAVSAPGTAATVVGILAELSPDDDAPDGEGVTTADTGVEGVALLESDPEAVPTFAGGVLALRDVPAGEHRLTVNAAGVAPYSEHLTVDGGTDSTPTETTPQTETPTQTETPAQTGTPPKPGASDPPGVATAGVDGRVAVTPREDAVKLRLDGAAAETPLASVSVGDDFGGQVYATAVDGRDAVYLHRDGAYTADVRDEAGTPGAVRVNPGPDEATVTVDQPETGKASLAAYLVDLFAETRETVRAGAENEGKVEGLLQALSAVEDGASRAVQAAHEGNPQAADRRLDAVLRRIENVREALTDAALSAPAERATRKRSDLAEERAELAKRTDL